MEDHLAVLRVVDAPLPRRISSLWVVANELSIPYWLIRSRCGSSLTRRQAAAAGAEDWMYFSPR